MSEWKEYKLKDIISKITDNRGKNPPHISSGIPIIETSALTTGTKYADKKTFQKFVSKDTYENWFRAGHPNYNDLLIATVGNGIGSVALMPDLKSAIAQNIVGLSFNQKNATGEFYYYYFNQDSVQYLLKGMDIGSAQPSLKVPHLLSLDVPVPSIEEQNKITEILASLDDKIDLLHRQNKTLEQLAETLFRQWFVEEAKENWRIGKLGDVLELIYGKALKEEVRTGKGFPVVGSSGIVGYNSEYLVEAPGIVIGRKGTLGKVLYLFENFFPIDTTYFVKSKSKSVGLFYEYFLLKTLNFEEMNSDSAVPGLNRDIALSTEIKIPYEKTISNFNEHCDTIFVKIKKNVNQISSLTQLRDTLLPKLMSGEVRVK